MFWFSEHTTVYISNYSSIFLAIQQVLINDRVGLYDAADLMKNRGGVESADSPDK